MKYCKLEIPEPRVGLIINLLFSHNFKQCIKKIKLEASMLRKLKIKAKKLQINRSNGINKRESKLLIFDYYH